MNTRNISDPVNTQEVPLVGLFILLVMAIATGIYLLYKKYYDAPKHVKTSEQANVIDEQFNFVWE